MKSLCLGNCWGFADLFGKAENSIKTAGLSLVYT